MRNYCICCGKVIPEGELACKNCNRVSLEELELRKKVCDIMREASKPIEYGGDLYHSPEIYIPKEEDILDAMLQSGFIKLNLEENK